MKNIIILSLLLLLSTKSNSQEKVKRDDNKFLISLHYTGNSRNDNFVSDNYNGILGLNAHYVLFNNELISVQGGLGLDYFQGRVIDNQVDLKNRVMVNPNFGIEFNASKTFKPFFNLGYSFFSAKYVIKTTNLNLFDPMDPAFQSGNFEETESFNSLSINPGFRLYFNDKIYFQTDYKYLPIESNINSHILALGIGLKF
ncbi:outer membrane beta-barrel protein [Flavobacterium chungnamense]|uniref:Outer membrane protein beta-barrel domain-containing protein n=1 Tax=Flavobacterium chungnamense TaxID=706182 RepID=A0ABP7UK28_9FLAO